MMRCNIALLSHFKITISLKPASVNGFKRFGLGFDSRRLHQFNVSQRGTAPQNPRRYWLRGFLFVS